MWPANIYLVMWLTDWLTDQPTNWPNDWRSDRPTDQLTDQLMDRPTDRWTHRPTERLTNQPTDRLQAKERKIPISFDYQNMNYSFRTHRSCEFCASMELYYSRMAFSAQFSHMVFCYFNYSMYLWPHLSWLGFCGLKTWNDITGMYWYFAF